MSYVFNIILFQLLFLMLYNVFKRETFHQYNRFYLLLSSSLSLCLPFVSLRFFQKTDFPRLIESTLPKITLVAHNENAMIVTESNSFLFDWFSIWMLGSILMSIVFVLKLRKLILLFKYEKVIRTTLVTYVELKNSKMAFSFMNWVFLGDGLYGNEKAMVLEHELIHVKEKHSWDLLFFEIQRILFWFSPFVYLYQKEIKVVHEFRVDYQMRINRGTKEYCKNILNQVLNAPSISLVHTFYKQSLIKKRIAMLTKRKSTSNAKLKYVFIIPLITGMLFYTSCTENKNIKRVPLQAVQVSPIFPGCTGNEDVKECFTKNVQKFISTNFDVSTASKLGLTGVQKMTSVFTINTDGEVVDIKVSASNIELENELLRVLESLPKMEAGVQNGEACEVLFQLPIVFRLNE